jgi:hypothetical protein
MKSTNVQNRATALLLTALILGFSADLLFYGKRLGISLLLFVLLFVAALYYLSRREQIAYARQNVWLILPLLFFASMVAVRANPFLNALNVLAVLTLLAFLVANFVSGRIHELQLSTTLLLPLYTAGRGLISPAPVLADSLKGQGTRIRSENGLVPVVMPLVKGGALAVPLLLFFALLLASADLIFADRLASVLQLARLGDLFRLAWRGLVIVIISWLVAGGLAIALSRRQAAETLEENLSRLQRPFSLGFVESTTILVLINLLFLSFVAFQFRYLFGGEAQVQLAGYTYAEYARRGFFELVTVAVISLALILGLNWLTWRETKSQLRLFKILGSLLTLLVMIMLASAFYRMRLYEAAFGYTELRLTVTSFIVWLAALLGWFIGILWRWPGRFAIGLMAVSIGFVATLNMLNPDAFIVRQNMARYRVSGDLDVSYLVTLSDDAVPELLANLAELEGDGTIDLWPWCEYYREGDSREISKECYLTRVEIIDEDLIERLEALETNSGWRRWQSTNLSLWRSHRLLAEAFE